MSSILKVHTGVTAAVAVTVTPVSATYNLADGMSLGARVQRRDVATSPFLAGRQLVAAYDDISEMMVPIIVRGAASTQALQSRIQTLVNAFTQFSYHLTYEHHHLGEIATYKWLCEKADWALGDGGQMVNTLWHGERIQVVNFSVPRTGSVAGPL